MRRLLLATACLLGVLPPAAVPGEPARLHSPQVLSQLAGTSVRLFDARASDRLTRFRRFLSTATMRGGGALPSTLVDDTAAAVRLYLSTLGTGEPVYFVGSYVDKVLTFDADERRYYAARYATQVTLPTTCPVFVAAGTATTAELLARAANLPVALFEQAAGSSARLHRLFVLTELSHCGFLAHGIEHPGLRGAIDSAYALRALLESIGDYEATALFREEQPARPGPDEADLLFAARVLSLFLSERAGPYAAVPPMMALLQAHGLAEGSQQLGRARAAVTEARRGFWHELARYRGIETASLPLAEMGAALASAAEREADPLTASLLRYFPIALEVLAISQRPVTPARIAAAGWLPGGAGDRARLTLPGRWPAPTF